MMGWKQSRTKVDRILEIGEDYWIDAIKTGEDPKYGTKQIIDPKEHLSYQKPEAPFSISEADFMKTVIDYELYERGIDAKSFEEGILNSVLYSGRVCETDKEVVISIQK